MTHMLRRVGSSLFSPSTATNGGDQTASGASGNRGNSASNGADGATSDAKATLTQLADRTGNLARQAGASLQNTSLSIMASGIGVASPRLLDLVV
ncbi:hypothetical protein [Telmatospirillum siberiense]|nr:hypothetical protein [Telmatospirillum siberiense]